MLKKGMMMPTEYGISPFQVSTRSKDDILIMSTQKMSFKWAPGAEDFEINEGPDAHLGKYGIYNIVWWG